MVNPILDLSSDYLERDDFMVICLNRLYSWEERFGSDGVEFGKLEGKFCRWEMDFDN